VKEKYKAKYNRVMLRAHTTHNCYYSQNMQYNGNSQDKTA